MRNCVICGCDKLKSVFKIPKFPVFMGATTLSPSKAIFKTLEYEVCQQCFNLQIKQLVPLKVLYQSNHNIDVVGQIWQEHHQSFAEFIQQTTPKIVVEIGSPTATIYKILHNEQWLGKWYSIEPNPSIIDDSIGKFTIINQWLDNSFSFSKYIQEQPAAIVMSHVFEHLYNPSVILDVLYENLQIGGNLFISIPNMQHISDNHLMPPSGLHFEHTYYVELDGIKHLLQKSGFQITDTFTFKNHSLFIRGTKVNYRSSSKTLDKIQQKNTKNITNFLQTISDYQNIVQITNKTIRQTDREIYLYSAHFPSQFLLSMGLEEGKIWGCLDQSLSKIGKTLNGTNLTIFSPEILRGKDNVLVICYMGPYTDEIKDTILKINPKVKFI